MDTDKKEIFTVTEGEAGARLDLILAERFRGVKSRKYFQDLILQGLVEVNGVKWKKRERLGVGDTVEIRFLQEKQIGVEPENISLNILYEDDAIIVVNKPPGMVVHPAPGNWSGTLVNALLFHCKDSLQFKPNSLADPLPRPGIVHRLDKDTSGVMVAAKHTMAHERLVSSFSKREVKKQYLAVCLGNPGIKTFAGRIGRHPIRRKQMTVLEDGGKEAVTYCEVMGFNGKLSFVKLTPKTGRTHQLRVHLQHNRTPILGDDLYGSPGSNRLFAAKRQMLHAWKLEFTHPETGEAMSFTANIPEDMHQYSKLFDIIY